MSLQRVNRTTRCPICGADSWCGVRADGLAVCMRTPSDRKTSDGSGWIHVVDGGALSSLPAARNETPRMSSAEATLIARQCFADIGDRRRDALAGQLGLSPRSLIGLRVGWHIDRNVFTFPMRDEQGRVIGIRTRTPEGEKRAITGSRSGLFVPQDSNPIDNSTLIVCEGPTDTAAAIDLGFHAIGRPDATSGADRAAARQSFPRCS